MQANHKPENDQGARLSRRTFLQFAAAGSAATLPAVALAAADGKHPRHLPPLSDEQQLDACITQLKDILRRMHPDCGQIRVGGYANSDGGETILVEVLPSQLSMGLLP